MALNLFRRHRSPAASGTVAFNMKPVRGPWGGSSPFVAQLSSYLRRNGYRVAYKLVPEVDLIVMVDPRTDPPAKPFGLDEIRDFLKAHPGVRVLHRINECDQRKSTAFMDDMLARANRLADYSVFISSWIRDYHAERWFDAGRPHAVVYNGADRAVFHPRGAGAYDGSSAFRLVTHHWSDNPLKGFDVYRQIDDLLYDGTLKDTEFWVVGRWPAEIRWRAARTFPPCLGEELAALLRACHAYVTASRWEPCGMHHVEGAQCGLPLLYHEDGGGIVEAGKRYGLGFRDDIAGAVAAMRRDYDRYRRRLFRSMPSGERMCLAYGEIIQGLMCGVPAEAVAPEGELPGP